MNLTDQRARQAKQRDRRAWIASTVMLVAIAIALIALTHFPRHSVPIRVRGLITMLLAASVVAANLYVERADAWQRTRAVNCFALGGLTGAIWLAVECLRAKDADPGYPLAAIGFVWLAGDVAFRIWPNMRTADRDQ